MKTRIFLKNISSRRSIAFAFVMVISALILPLSGLTSSTANAISDEQMQKCYDTFNGRDLNGLKGMTLQEQDLYNQVCKSFCKVLDNGGDVTKPLITTCPNPTSLRQIQDAEVGPLVKLVCGDAPAGENAQPAYLDCASKARAAYEDCDNFIVPIQGPVEDTDANTAKCTYGKLTSPKPTLAKIQAAVTKGRNDAKAAATAATNEQQQAEEKTKCEADGGTWTDNKCNANTNEKSKRTCVIDGIGWMICPVMGLMGGLVDGAYAVVSGLLKVQPLVVTGGTAGIYDAWSIMRNFANVAFVIAFLIIIFSQMTSVGISNYGIKKMLPRLIVAAILVNISFWICAIAVDLSNISGSSINDLFKGITSGLAKTCVSTVTPVSGADAEPCLGSAWDTGNGIWAKLASFAVVGALGIGAALYVTLSALLPALVIALFAILTVFLVLTLRQALIILLIVIAPLAFVAYLLPNTESLFKKWKDLFQTLLLMYPIIGLIFGASALASTVVMTSASASGANPAIKIPVQIMGALISIIPLAITPIVMRAAGGLLNRFGGIVNNPNKGPRDRLMKLAQGNKDNRQAIARERRTGRARRFLERGADDNGKASRVRRIGAWAAGSGTTTGINQEQKTENAKKALAEARQSYVASRASTPDQSYARAIAGPTGNPEKVIAQAQDVVRQEAIENVKRIAAQMNSSGRDADTLMDEVASDQYGIMFDRKTNTWVQSTLAGAGQRRLSEDYLSAAVSHIGKTGRAQAVQNLADFVGRMGSEREQLGEEGPRAAVIKDVQQWATDAFQNSKVKPKTLASSDLTAMNDGKFTNTIEVPVLDAAGNATGSKYSYSSDDRMSLSAIKYFNDKKANKQKLAGMDIDEMWHIQRHAADIIPLLSNEGKASLAAAIDGLVGKRDPAGIDASVRDGNQDKLLSGPLETRQFEALDNIRSML